MSCPSCGYILGAFETSCPKCGQVPGEPAVIARTAPEPSIPPATPQPPESQPNWPHVPGTTAPSGSAIRKWFNPQMRLVLAASAGVYLLALGLTVGNRINASYDQRQKPSPTPTPVPIYNEPGAITVTRTVLSPTKEAFGQLHKELFIHWQNNSNVTIRTLYADVVGWDASGRMNYEHNHATIYNAGTDQNGTPRPGIAPGESFIPTDVNCKPVQEWDGEVVKVKVTIVGYSE